MSSSSPSSYPASAKARRASEAPAKANTPSTTARCAPARTVSAEARPPTRSVNACTSKDLPAPVSPDSTLSPPSGLNDASRITARS